MSKWKNSKRNGLFESTQTYLNRMGFIFSLFYICDKHSNMAFLFHSARPCDDKNELDLSADVFERACNLCRRAPKSTAFPDIQFSYTETFEWMMGGNRQTKIRIYSGSNCMHGDRKHGFWERFETWKLSTTKLNARVCQCLSAVLYDGNSIGKHSTFYILHCTMYISQSLSS